MLQMRSWHIFGEVCDRYMGCVGAGLDVVVRGGGLGETAFHPPDGVQRRPSHFHPS